MKKLFFAACIGVAIVSCNSKKEVKSLSGTMDSVSYSIGVNIGQNIKNEKIDSLNLDILAQAISDVYNDGNILMDDAQAKKVLQSFLQSQHTKKYDVNKKAGIDFLEKNKTNAGVVTLESGLQYQIVKEGTGPKPTLNDMVKTHYHGTTVDGKVFDSSVERGEPVTFPVAGVIPGWTEALQLMPVGSKWKVFVPYQLAYGEQGAPPSIDPYSTLIFEVELLSIEKAAK